MILTVSKSVAQVEKLGHFLHWILTLFAIAMELEQKAQFQPEDVVLTGGSCFTQVLSVLLLMPYSRSSCGYDFPSALYKSTICCFNSRVYDFWFFAMLNISFAISLAIIDGSTFSAHTYILTPRIIKSEHSNINLNVIRF